jgi:hypothetical protein
LWGIPAGAFTISANAGDKKPASAFAKTGCSEVVLAAFVTRPQAERKSA